MGYGLYQVILGLGDKLWQEFSLLTEERGVAPCEAEKHSVHSLWRLSLK